MMASTMETLAQRDLREEKLIGELLRAKDKYEAAVAIQPADTCPNDKRVWEYTHDHGGSKQIRG